MRTFSVTVANLDDRDLKRMAETLALPGVDEDTRLLSHSPSSGLSHTAFDVVAESPVGGIEVLLDLRHRVEWALAKMGADAAQIVKSSIVLPDERITIVNELLANVQISR